MVLDIGGGLFGEMNPLTEETQRIFNLSRPQRHKRIVMPGWAVVGSATFTAGGLQNYKREMGFATTVHLMNESGASRNATIVIENLTTSVTLVSGNVDLSDGNFFNTAFSWSLEDIKPGDSIKFTLGNEGVGTANANGSYAWTCAGANFVPYSDTTTYGYDSNSTGALRIDEESEFTLAPVSLPTAAIVTGCVITGNFSDETWELVRVNFATAATTQMATANVNTEDTTISSATINNGTYVYFISTSSINTNDRIYGARITYTLADRHNSTAGYYEFELNGFFKSLGETSDE